MIKIKKSFLIVSFLNLPIALSAQNVSGIVVNQAGKPLSYASVLFKDAVDSTLVCRTMTDEQGRFQLGNPQVHTGKLRISYLGYQPFEITCKDGKVGAIVLREDSTMLDVAEVVTSRIRHDATGYTISFRSFDIVKGKMMAEALPFLPNLSKEDGVFKINGLPVSEVIVDGVKLGNLSELDNIPAKMIDKVKVNYMVGSGQSAELSGGTIEITLRQPKGGFYGSFMADVTVAPSYGWSNENGGAVFYARYKGLSVYDNLSLGFNQPQEENVQTFGLPSSDTYQTLKEKVRYRGHALYNRLSLNLQLSERSTLGASYYITSNKNLINTYPEESELSPFMCNKAKALDQEVTLQFTSHIGKKGTELVVSGDYYHRGFDGDMQSNLSDTRISRVNDESRLNLYKVSLDLKSPVGRQLLLKYGTSMQSVAFDYKPNLTLSEGVELIPTKNRGYSPIAYIEAMGSMKRLQYMVGINAQVNHILFESLDNHEQSKNTQWGVQPTLQLMMPLDKQGKYALMLNYKRTLQNIPYSAISSTVRWSDPHNYTVGNPDLQAPAFDMVMAGVSLWRNLLNLSAIYVHGKDEIFWATSMSDKQLNVYFTQPINLSSSHSYGLMAELNVKPVKPWLMKLSARYEFRPENMTLNGIYYGYVRLRQYYMFYNDFNFSHGWGGMLNFNYEPTFRHYDRTYHAIYNLSGSIYKNFWKNWQARINFTALGDRRSYGRHAGTVPVTFDNTTPVHTIGLSLVWNFSGGKRMNVQTVEGIQRYDEVKDIR